MNTSPAAANPAAMLTVNDVCASHGIGRTTFYAEVAAGRLRAVKLGSKTAVLSEDAEAWRRSLPTFELRAAALLVKSKG